MGCFKKILSNPIIDTAAEVASAFIPGVGPAISAGIGAAANATEHGGSLLGDLEGGLQGYSAGSLGQGLATMGGSLAAGNGLGTAFTSGFPTISGIGSSVENGLSTAGTSLENGADALGNTLGFGGADNTLGTGQTLGSELGSLFGGASNPGLGTSLPEGAMPIGTNIDGFNTGGAVNAPLSTFSGMADNAAQGGASATGNDLMQGLASQNAAAAGGASNSLGSMLATGSTTPGMGATMGAGLNPGGIAAGGGGLSSMGGSGGVPSGDPSLSGYTGYGQYSPAATATPAMAAAPAAASGSNPLSGLSGVGSLLSGISGLSNASTIKNAEGQLQAGQQLNQQQIAPYLQTGATATGNLNNLLNPGTSAASLANTPGYQFELQQGNNALNNQMAASGMTGSGSALKAAQAFGQGLAGTTYQNAVSNNLAASGQGLGAVGSNAGYNTALGNIGAAGTQSQNSNLLATLAGLLGQKSTGLNSFAGI